MPSKPARQPLSTRSPRGTGSDGGMKVKTRDAARGGTSEKPKR